jgi:hypothetical protein
MKYDTYVLERDQEALSIPEHMDSRRVCAWSSGHSLAEMEPVRQFIKDLAEGGMESWSLEGIRVEAAAVLALSETQNQTGYTE